MAKEWHIEPDWPDREQAAAAWHVSPLVSQILFNRHIVEQARARAFLAPKLNDLYEPHLLPGAEPAAERIAHAVKRGERIVIYGDYDVDGITGAAILWHALRQARAEVDVYVPHRLEEGYGLNAEALIKLRESGANLVVSVDCGITACEAARTAREIGLDLIVTDHHTPHQQLPDCCAIVHPAAQGTSPNPDLCGAGVAFKLAWIIAQKISNGIKVTPAFRQFLLDATGLAALGTIADVVSLVGENRIIARHGLSGLPNSSIAGVQALIESAGLKGESIDSYDVGFKLAPRLNAAGRMGHARLAVELLTRANDSRSREIARYLEDQNRARRTLEKQICAQARDMVHQEGLDRDDRRAIVLAAHGWHAGVIGIVAARLVDEFHRPTVMIALENGVGQGSARSIRHFELNLALQHCSQHLLSFGGHRMAAGLKIELPRIEAFREAFLEYAGNRLTAKDLIPTIRIDAQVRLDELDGPTVQTILDLGPFGMGNPKPRLATDWLDLEGEPRRVGQSQDHLQFALRQDQVMRRAIGFGLGKHLQQMRDTRRCRIAFEPIINHYQGRKSIEMHAIDIQFPAA